MKLPIAGFALAVPLLTAACIEAPDRGPVLRAPAAQIAGEAATCVPLAQIRTATVHDEVTIDFELASGQVLRNTLPSRCPQLRFENRFAHQPSMGRICSDDLIRTVRGSGSACRMGEFVPISLAALD